MQWVRVFQNEAEARERMIPDKPQLVILHGVRICLVLHDDRFFAVQDRCTHNSDSLSRGRVNFQGEVICPWHGYRFSLRTGQSCDSSCRDLATYPVRSDDTGFYIGLY